MKDYYYHSCEGSLTLSYKMLNGNNPDVGV